MPAEAERGRLRFSVLGPVRAWRDGREVELGPPQQRALLALLLARPRQPIEVEQIVDMLWGDEPPVSALTVVYRYIGLLRRLLEPDLPTRASGHWLLRGAGGYRMEMDPESLDLLRFRRLARDARAARDSGAAHLGVPLYVEALALWQGPTADGIPSVVRAHPVFTALDRERHTLVKEAADVALRCGAAGELLGALRRCATERPMDEPLHARLLHALAATGRSQEAARTYQAVRARLEEELGIGPGPELRAAARLALSGRIDPVEPAGEGGPPPAAPARSRAWDTHPVPAQLPPDLPVFVGRRRELARMPLPAVDRVAVVGVSGTPGVGKTSLALHWAHRAAADFPDGQLYANLRGFRPGEPRANPAVVLGSFLQALGVPPEDVPADAQGRARLYRKTLFGRRVLVVLDDVRDAEHIQPLLPGAPGCLAVVTSRGVLDERDLGERDLGEKDSELGGARVLTLEPFDADDARDCLTARLGGERVAAEEDAVAEIIDLTAGQPLALAVVAARAAARGVIPLAVTAAELRESRVGPDTAADLRAALDASYTVLSPAAAGLYRSLAGYPGRTFSAFAAAAAAGVPVQRARDMLAEFVRVGLTTVVADHRYAWHPLLRAHSTELALAHDDGPTRRAARHRILDHGLRTLRGATRELSPNSAPTALPTDCTAAEPGTSPPEHLARDQALAWFGAELPVLLELARHAARDGLHRYVWEVVWALEVLLDRQGLHHDDDAIRRSALEAARRLDDPTAVARMHRAVGRAAARQGRYDDAHAHLISALRLSAEVGEAGEEAAGHLEFGHLYVRQGHYGQAVHHWEQAVTKYRSIGDALGYSTALHALGGTHGLAGQHRKALVRTRQALESLRGLNEPHAEAAAWQQLGDCHLRCGSRRRAVVTYRRALGLYRAVGDRHNEYRSLVRLGDAHHAAGEASTARTAWRQALAIRECARFPPLSEQPSSDALRAGLRVAAAGSRGPMGRPPKGRPALRAVPGGSA
ncbi:BTAD domain-containing putative transcriptional regulator [Streptomyces sp. NPDC005811]|uniref:AfsR/SARP family transcriptional regulator n=1 Tax=Streptomyces sp. NPDC005811 TaxID=3154565 RepID=UPI0033DFCE64